MIELPTENLKMRRLSGSFDEAERLSRIKITGSTWHKYNMKIDGI